MATISNTPRPGYVWDATDNCWYPIGTGPHSHADYITAGSAINPNIVDAKGDIIAATAADTVARLAVGANGTVLTADSAEATGLKWTTPASGSMTQLATGTLSGASVVLSSISGSYKDLVLVIRGLRPGTDGEYTKMRLNGDTGTNYNPNTTNQVDGLTISDNALQLDRMPDDTVTKAFHHITLLDYANTSTVKVGRSFAIVPDNTTSTNYNFTNRYLYYNSTNAITSITLFPSAGVWGGGTYFLYGVN